MKAQLKGLLVEAGKIEKFGETKVLKLTVVEPARLDNYGEQIGKEMRHEVKCINKGIDKLPASLIEAVSTSGKVLDPKAKVNLTVYVNSRQFNSKEGIEMTATELILSEIEILN